MMDRVVKDVRRLHSCGYASMVRLVAEFLASGNRTCNLAHGRQNAP